MLARRGISWESEEHLAFVDKVFERINHAAIEASTELSREKGCYEYSSRAATGRRELILKSAGYDTPEWKELGR